MSSNVITTTLYIENMTCVNCENTIEHALVGIVGIESVKASYSSGTVTITYDLNEIVLEKIEKIIEEHDYQVQRQKNNQKEKYTVSKSANKMDLTNVIAIGIIIFALYVILKRFGLLNIFYSFPIAKEGMGYGMLFIIGLLTSVHCVAMCGGICLSQCTPKESGTAARKSKFSAIRPSLLYNLGRVTSYT